MDVAVISIKKGVAAAYTKVKRTFLQRHPPQKDNIIVSATTRAFLGVQVLVGFCHGSSDFFLGRLQGCLARLSVHRGEVPGSNFVWERSSSAE